VPSLLAACSLRPAGSFSAASALVPEFVPGDASRVSSTLPAVAAAATPFVPRSGAGQQVPAAPQGQSVTFMRGATRGGVPVTPGASAGAAQGSAGLPDEEDLFHGLAGDMQQRMHLHQALGGQAQALRALVQADGAALFVPRVQSGADAAAAAVGPLGPGMGALPPPRRLAGAANPHGRVPHGGRFSSDALRSELARRSALCGAQLAPGSEEAERTPAMLHTFHSVVPLEEELAEEAPSPCLGLRTALFKGVSSADGSAAALRRLDSSVVPPSAGVVGAAAEVVQRWSPLGGHPALCTLRGAFVADDGSGDGGSALYVVHDYLPGAISLAQAHLQAGCPPCVEDALWAAATQLAGALAAIHAAGLAARPPALAPTKVLLATGGRLWLSACGLPDLLAGQGAPGTPRPVGNELRSLQRGDLVALGHLLLALGCGPRPPGGRPSLHTLQHRVSPRLTSLVAALLDGEAGLSDTSQLAAALGEAALGALANAHAAQDALLAELAREAENGRQLRLLAKLGFVLRHGGSGTEGGGGESGDVYLLRLFRDHALAAGAGQDGAPAMDWGALYEALNKLDAGVPERIQLLSRDEASILVASYQDLKSCAERAYAQLEQQQIRAQQGGGWQAE
jgi:PAB-dependent poly(A)-specific ribonuclease subunit 3